MHEVGRYVIHCPRLYIMILHFSHEDTSDSIFIITPFIILVWAHILKTVNIQVYFNLTLVYGKKHPNKHRCITYSTSILLSPQLWLLLNKIAEMGFIQSSDGRKMKRRFLGKSEFSTAVRMAISLNKVFVSQLFFKSLPIIASIVPCCYMQLGSPFSSWLSNVLDCFVLL